MENNENVQLKESNNSKNIGVFLALLFGYIMLPSLIALFLYKSFDMDETLASFIGNISYVFLLFIIYYEMFKDKIKDYFSNFSKYLKLTLKYWGLGLLVMIGSNLILSFIFSGNIAANEELNREFVLGNPIFGFVSIAILAPFVEEIIFRYGVRKFTGKSKYFPLVSAIAFGIPHIIAGINPPFGFSDVLQFLYVIPYGALGYAFAYIYNETDNIFTSMTAHALHNFMCFIVIVTLV